MIGHSADDLAQLVAQVKNLNVDDALRFLGGKGFANAQQLKLLQSIGGVGSGAKGAGAALARFAGSKAVNNALRVVPGIGLGITALDAADIVTNDTSILNKGMDAAAMGVGGTIGGVIGMGNRIATLQVQV